METTPDLTDRAAWSRREFAQLVGVSYRTVERWVSAGHVRTVRIGGTVRISRTELDRLMTPVRPE